MEGYEPSPPIRTFELHDLQDYKIPKDKLTWSRVRLTSDKFMCITVEKPNNSTSNSQVFLFDPTSPRNQLGLQKYSIEAELAQISPSGDFIACRHKQHIIVYHRSRLINKQSKRRIRSQSPIKYWLWINNDILAFVTGDDVWYWDVHKNDKPRKVLSVAKRLFDMQIVSFEVAPNDKWFALTALVAREEYIEGVAQLFSQDYNLGQCISAHAVHFFRYQFEGNRKESNILAVATRHKQSRFGKVYIIELGPHQNGNYALSSHFEEITFHDTADYYDFPISIQASQTLGLLYVFTKYGKLYIHDIESSNFLYSEQISDSVVFSTTLCSQSSTPIALCTSGKIILVELNLAKLACHLKDSVSYQKLAPIIQGRDKSGNWLTIKRLNKEEIPFVDDSVDSDSDNSTSI